jgi:hypothetical protein
LLDETRNLGRNEKFVVDRGRVTTQNKKKSTQINNLIIFTETSRLEKSNNNNNKIQEKIKDKKVV